MTKNKTIFGSVFILSIALMIGGLTNASAHNSENGSRSQRFEQKRDHKVQVLENLGLDPQDVKKQIEAGSTFDEILTNAGLSRDDVHNAMKVKMQERIARAVADGRLTQQEANEKLANMEKRHEIMEQAHVLKESGDKEGARQLIKNSGIKLHKVYQGLGKHLDK